MTAGAPSSSAGVAFEDRGDHDAAGDHARARELLTEAIAMYMKIGMPKHVEMAEELLAGS